MQHKSIIRHHDTVNAFNALPLGSIHKNAKYQSLFQHICMLSGAPDIRFYMARGYKHGINDVENFQLHKLISPTSALPKYLMKQYICEEPAMEYFQWET
ncbi:uncharacterized protein V6R79_021470 [Siganus canaliculatus]